MIDNIGKCERCGDCGVVVRRFVEQPRVSRWRPSITPPDVCRRNVSGNLCASCGVEWQRITQDARA